MKTLIELSQKELIKIKGKYIPLRVNLSLGSDSLIIEERTVLDEDGRDRLVDGQAYSFLKLLFSGEPQLKSTIEEKVKKIDEALGLNWEEQWQELISKVESADDINIKDLFTMSRSSNLTLIAARYLDIGRVISQCSSAKRIKTEGFTKLNRYWINGKLVEKENDFIYELYEVKESDLGLPGSNALQAVKCWCTSTNEEHWLWLEGSFRSPIEGIASTCHLPTKWLEKEYIDYIDRQGDKFLVYLKDEYQDEAEKPGAWENTRPLTGGEYIRLIRNQS